MSESLEARLAKLEAEHSAVLRWLAAKDALAKAMSSVTYEQLGGIMDLRLKYEHNADLLATVARRLEG